MAEPLTEEGVRRVLVEIFQAAADALNVESKAEVRSEPPPEPRLPSIRLGDRATLTVEEVAQILGISRWAAYEGCRRGEIPSLRLGRRVVIPVSRLQEHLSGP